jgi:hypothetical protein
MQTALGPPGETELRVAKKVVFPDRSPAKRDYTTFVPTASLSFGI